MLKKIIFMLIFIVPLVFAIDEYKLPQSPQILLSVPCSVESTGDICDNTTQCNVSLFYPNSSIFVMNGQMIYFPGFENYTINDTTVKGKYLGIMNCRSSISSPGTYTFIMNIGNSTMTPWECPDDGIGQAMLWIVFVLIIGMYILFIKYDFIGIFKFLTSLSFIIWTALFFKPCQDIIAMIFFGLGALMMVYSVIYGILSLLKLISKLYRR